MLFNHLSKSPRFCTINSPPRLNFWYAKSPTSSQTTTSITILIILAQYIETETEKKKKRNYKKKKKKRKSPYPFVVVPCNFEAEHHSKHIPAVPNGLPRASCPSITISTEVIQKRLERRIEKRLCGERVAVRLRRRLPTCSI